MKINVKDYPDIAEALRDRVVQLEAENAELRVELARIKPSWNDAPKWAEYLMLSWCPWAWYVGDPTTKTDVLMDCVTLDRSASLERRPESE